MTIIYKRRKYLLLNWSSMEEKKLVEENNGEAGKDEDTEEEEMKVNKEEVEVESDKREQEENLQVDNDKQKQEGIEYNVNKVKKKRKRTVLLPYFDNDLPLVNDFWKTTKRNVHSRIERRVVNCSIDKLKQDRNKIFPVGELPLVAESLVVCGEDGIPLLYYLKGALQWPFEKMDPSPDGLKALNDLVQLYKPPRPKANNKRYCCKSLKKEHGVYFFTLWHATGQGNNTKKKNRLTKGAVISKDIHQNCDKLNATLEYLHAFTPITQAIGALFQVVDPNCYQKCSSFYLWPKTQLYLC
jgi:hypothetical protein